MVNRRRFLQATAGAAAFLGTAQRANPFAQSLTGISKFAVQLPGLGPTGIPVLTPRRVSGRDYYEIVAKQFTQQIHPNIPSTTFWGYADAAAPGSARYLGGVIVAKRKTPVRVKLTNLLPATHILPVDPTAIDPSMGAEVGGRVDRIALHIHGGLVHWDSDGGPFAWFSNKNNPGGFVHGSSFLNGASGYAIHDYYNDQSARQVWYHDHAYGLTRLNAYAGLASAYLITDDAESGLINAGILPSVPGYPLGIPLIIQDKTFFDPDTDPAYPVTTATKGSLWYPHIYESPATGQDLPGQTLNPLDCGNTGRWDSNTGTPPPISLVAEFFADIALVNGAPYPNLNVAPRRYRFRILNGSNSRFYNLQLYVKNATPDGITLAQYQDDVDNNGNPLLAPTNPVGPRMIQIGTEGGFLPAPVVLTSKPIGYFRSPLTNDPNDGNANRYTLLLGPGERADVIIDFRGFAGRKIILYSDAPSPFPGGDIRNDYYPGRPDMTCIGGAPAAVPGYGPDTRVLMQFTVSNNGAVSELNFNATVNALNQALPIAYAASQPGTLSDPQPAKVKTLNEDFDSYGRLAQTLGAPTPTDVLASPTETAHQGEVQTWQIYNLTGDVHPMHFHLVNVHIIKREAYQFDPSTGLPILPLSPIPGTARGPDANEKGWKETVRMNPGEVITVRMKFDLPPGNPLPSPRLQASYGIKGAEYVWHCHILEHEEHDMMHSLVVYY